MKYVAALVAASLVSTSATAQAKTSDGYWFKPEITINQVEVTLVTKGSAREVREAAEVADPKMTKTSRGVVNAFAQVDAVNRKCVITIVDPTIKIDLEALGHEVAHCFYRNWHK